MRLIKFLIAAIMVILILNFFHLLSPDFSKKVDNASNYTKESLKNWQSTPLGKNIDLNSDSGVFKDIVNDIKSVSFKMNKDKSFSFNGNELSGTYSYNDPAYLEIKFNAGNIESVKQAEAVISIFEKKIFHFESSQIKNKSTTNIKVTKNGDKYRLELI